MSCSLRTRPVQQNVAQELPKEFPNRESVVTGNLVNVNVRPISVQSQLNLKSLLLNRTRVNDESIAELRAMNTLEHLDLTRTKVTDAGLEHLESLPNLKKLVLRRSLVTQEGYDWYLETQLESAKGIEPKSLRSIQQQLSGFAENIPRDESYLVDSF